MGKRIEKHFIKEDTWTANKHMKRCSASLVIKEMPIQSTVRYQYMPPERLKIKNKKTIPLNKESNKQNNKKS